MLRIVWDARSTVCRTASVKLSGDRPDSSMNFTTDIVPSLIVGAGYGLPETAGIQLGAGVVRGVGPLDVAGAHHARSSGLLQGWLLHRYGAQPCRTRGDGGLPSTHPVLSGLEPKHGIPNRRAIVQKLRAENPTFHTGFLRVKSVLSLSHTRQSRKC